MADDLDLRDMMLEVEADVQEVMRELMQELELPLMQEQFVKQWASLPEDMKKKFSEERPQEYAALMDLLKGE